MAGSAKSDLISALRARISDARPAVAAFALSVTGTCRSAVLELAGGSFVVTVENGTDVDGLELNLNSPQNSTVGRLVESIRRYRGYQAVLEGSYVSDHPSTDLTVIGLCDLKKQAVTLRHRIFSDGELASLIEQVVPLHNPNYSSVSNVPKTEHAYVVMKAAAAAYRALASDSAKRKALDTDAGVYLQLAADAERQYEIDSKRMHRVIPSAKADESKMGTGDIVQGQLYRTSMRTGYNSHYRNALPTVPPNLYDVADGDVEDTLVRLRWGASRENNFNFYEVWRDTTPNVERNLAGYLDSSVSPAVPGGAFGTSIQVFSGARAVSGSYSGFGADTPRSDINENLFVDGQLGCLIPLEPDTEYYYRVYAVNLNREVAASQVRRVRTKPQRARFTATQNVVSTAAVTPQTGPLAGGTTVTLQGTGFDTGVRVFLGGKECTIVSVNPTTLVITTPAFANAQFVGVKLDFVLRSVSGLQDVAPKMWTVGT